MLRPLSIPLATRRAVLQRANNACEDCSQEGRLGQPLTMHHLTYEKRYANGDSDEIFGKETPDDLAALCWECHQARHRDCFGEYHEDPNEKDDVDSYQEYLEEQD